MNSPTSNDHSAHVRNMVQPMTPEQLSALRIAAEARWRLNGIRDLLDAVDEIERLQSELAALNAPHCCAECEHLKETDEFVRYCTAAPIYIGNIETPWLCGHFKAKGPR